MAPEILLPQPGWKKAWRYLPAIFIVIIVIYIAADVYAASYLQHELAQIRRLHQPVSIKEITPPPVPPSQNAALLYTHAAAEIKDMESISSYNPKKFNEKEAALFLSKNQRALQLIRQATGRPQCRFPLDWENFPYILYFPLLGIMRNAQRVLSIQALYEAHTGDFSAALQDVRREFIVARHLSNEPSLDCATFACILEDDANNTLTKVLLAAPLTVAQARSYEATLPEIEGNACLHRALLSERAGMLNLYTLPTGLGKIPKPEEGWYLPAPIAEVWHQIIMPLNMMDEVYALRLWKVIISDAANPAPFIPSDGTKFDQRVTQTPWYACITKAFMPFYARSGIPFDRASVINREREIALALAAYHTRYHHYPATLAPAEKLWESAFPKDPFSGKPFRYKSDGKTFLLYSIGMNRRDDGGIWKHNNDGKKTKDDIAW